MMEKTKLLYLTEDEIDLIEKLDEWTINDYIRNMPEDKKLLVMKQFSKERAIRQWKYIAKEKY